jgi:hypothetical protein
VTPREYESALTAHELDEALELHDHVVSAITELDGPDPDVETALAILRHLNEGLEEVLADRDDR